MIAEAIFEYKDMFLRARTNFRKVISVMTDVSYDCDWD